MSEHSTIDADHARRVIRQHAETARLLGVDFLPMSPRDGGGSAVEALVAQTATEPHAEQAAPPREPEVNADRAPSLLDGMQPAGATTSASASASTAGVPDEVAVAKAEAALAALREKYEADAPHERFVTSFTNIVFGEGHARARLMFVGEAPGADEDRTGRPFVGRAGQLLDKMIVAMGTAREAVYIANVLKTRPPNNATPTSEEARLCAPYLYEQIRIVAPEVIVTLGLPATRLLLESAESMGKLRGRWAELDLPASDTADAHTAAVMPTYHPAYLLRAYTDENRGKVWSDLQQVMDRLGLVGAKR